MEEVGEVIDNKGKSAIVKIERHSACSKCDKNCKMDDDHESSEMLVEVDNSVGATEGELVSLEMEGMSLVFSALLVYVFPLLGMILGYFIGSYLIPLENELPGIVGALTLLGISFLIIKLISSKKTIQPRITRIVGKSADNNDSFSCH